MFRIAIKSPMAEVQVVTRLDNLSSAHKTTNGLIIFGIEKQVWYQNFDS